MAASTTSICQGHCLRRKRILADLTPCRNRRDARDQRTPRRSIRSAITLDRASTHMPKPTDRWMPQNARVLSNSHGHGHGGNGGTARDARAVRGMYDRPGEWSRRCCRRRWCRPRNATTNLLGFARWLVVRRILDGARDGEPVRRCTSRHRDREDAEDFDPGEPPSIRPADGLATEFVRTGWDESAAKTIVMSAPAAGLTPAPGCWRRSR